MKMGADGYVHFDKAGLRLHSHTQRGIALPLVVRHLAVTSGELEEVELLELRGSDVDRILGGDGVIVVIFVLADSG